MSEGSKPAIPQRVLDELIEQLANEDLHVRRRNQLGEQLKEQIRKGIRSGHYSPEEAQRILDAFHDPK